MIQPPVCPYCGNASRLANGEEMYPHLPYLAGKNFYLCAPCNASVGCHPRTRESLGTLAKEPLRKLRSKVHAAFDPLWKHGFMSRQTAYALLARRLGIEKEQCHIGMFDESRCRSALTALEHKNL